MVLFGNVRMEIGGSDPNPHDRLIPTGFSVTGGVLFPLTSLPKDLEFIAPYVHAVMPLKGSVGAAASASIMGEADWGLIMKVWSQTPGL
jgi:hypothetical protein